MASTPLSRLLHNILLFLIGSHCGVTCYFSLTKISESLGIIIITIDTMQGDTCDNGFMEMNERGMVNKSS